MPLISLNMVSLNNEISAFANQIGLLHTWYPYPMFVLPAHRVYIHTVASGVFWIKRKTQPINNTINTIVAVIWIFCYFLSSTTPFAPFLSSRCTATQKGVAPFLSSLYSATQKGVADPLQPAAHAYARRIDGQIFACAQTLLKCGERPCSQACFFFFSFFFFSSKLSMAIGSTRSPPAKGQTLTNYFQNMEKCIAKS